jgi:LacI family transcriptional regulator
MKEIAEKTGFNISVVSRTLNRNPDKNARVSPKTRRTIEKAAESMGYRPNRAAEFLRRGSAPTIGVFLPKIANRLTADYIFGMADAAGEEGFPLSFSFGMTAECYARFVKSASHSSHCGIITFPYGEDMRYTHDSRIGPVLDGFQKKGGKVVLVYSLNDINGMTTVSVDEYEGGRLAAERLLARQCRQFFLMEPYVNRTEGFLDALREAGKDARVVLADQSGIEEIVRTASAAAPDNLPIGVFAACGDKHAVKVMSAVQRTPLRLGWDVMLIGYNDHRLGADLSPSLTTIHQPCEEMGKLAVRKIVNLVYEKAESSAKLKPFLVERETG